MEENNSKNRQYAIILGLVLGVIMVLLTAPPMYYYASSDSFWMVIIGPVITGFFLPLVVAVILTLRLRRAHGGYWGFREATTSIFTMMLIATIISSLGGFVFEKYVDPTMRERYLRNISNNSIQFMEQSGASTEEVDEQLARIDEQIGNIEEATLLSTLRGMLVSFIVVFVVSLIFAAIFKRERPMFNIPVDPETE